MSTYRVSMECTIEIHDEAQAQALAAESMSRRIRQTHTPGTHVGTSSGESPEVAIYGLSQEMPATALMIALEVLWRGAATVPWLEISDVDVSSSSVP